MAGGQFERGPEAGLTGHPSSAPGPYPPGYPQPPYGQPPYGQPPYGQPPTYWPASLPEPIRKARRRSRIYAAIWIASCLIFIPLVAFSVFLSYLEVTRSAQTNATPSEVVIQQGAMHDVTAYQTTYTWHVNGVTYSGLQTRRDGHDWADPAFVCYDPNNPSSGDLAYPGQTGCGAAELQWGPVVWVENIVLLVVMIVLPVVAFTKWRKWRALARQHTASA